MFDRVLNMPRFLILNITGSWTCRGYTAFRIGLNNFWTCLNMPKYAWMCLNESSCFFLFPHYNPLSIWMRGYLLISTSTFYIKLKVIAWGITRLLFWSDKIWFYSSWKYLICFRANIFTRLQITLFNWLCTKLISKNMILPTRKCLWTSLKLSRKVKHSNANAEKKIVAGFLARFAQFFSRYNFFYVNSRPGKSLQIWKWNIRRIY